MRKALFYIAFFEKGCYDEYMRKELQHDLLTHRDEITLAKAIADARSARERVAHGEPLDDHLVAIDAGHHARERFISANTRLAWSMASRFTRPGHVDLEDVYQDALIGLHTAVDRYDGESGYRFSTYATWWIRQAMQRGLENTGSSIRIPSEVRSNLLNEGVDPGNREKSAQRAMSVDSIDRTVGHDDFHIADQLTADLDVASDVADRVIAAEVVDLISELDAPTQSMLVRRYGLDGGDPASYQSIAEDNGISAPAVRKRILRAIDSIRHKAGVLEAS